MALNVDRYLDAIFAANPNLRNQDAQVAALVAAAQLADIPDQPPTPPVQVQRVDTRQPNGTITTEWEVVDRRMPKPQRIVKAGLATRELARAEAIKRAPVGGGAYTLSAVDSDEYFHDTDYELLGNATSYGVLSGCAVTEDAADLTADLAAGSILHNGIYVAVAVGANAYTLVADSSNERWAAACLSSAGAAVLVSGDAAASASVEPSKPEIGDRVLLKMWKIQAGQTIADNCEYKLDKRMWTSLRNVPIVKSAAETVNSGGTGNTLQNDDAFAFTVEADTDYLIECALLLTTGTTPDWKFAWTLTGMTWSGSYINDMGSTVAWVDASTTTSGTAKTVTATGATTLAMWQGKFLIHAGSTGGTLNFQWAQNTSDAGNTTVGKNSMMTITKLGAT